MSDGFDSVADFVTDGVKSLTGGAGDDFMSGDRGGDTLTGNTAANVLTGGLGNDIYVVGAGDNIIENDGEGIGRRPHVAAGAPAVAGARDEVHADLDGRARGDEQVRARRVTAEKRQFARRAGTQPGPEPFDFRVLQLRDKPGGEVDQPGDSFRRVAAIEPRFFFRRPDQDASVRPRHQISTALFDHARERQRRHLQQHDLAAHRLDRHVQTGP